MAVTAADVKEIATEFAAVADTRVDLFISEAETRTNRANWGGKADRGVIYLTAHLLKLDELQGAAPAGPITARRVHDVSWAYGKTGSGDGDNLDSTAWGRRYKQMRRSVFSVRVLR